MLVLKKIIAAVLVLASLAVSVFALGLCRSVTRSTEHSAPDAEAEATAAAESFFACLRARDFAGAYGYLANYSSLGLETPPEDEISLLYWNAAQDAWAFSVDAGYERNGALLEKRAACRRLDLSAVSDAVGAEVRAILARRVDEARLRSEIYNADGSYREDVAYAALLEATQTVLRDTAPYQYDQRVTLTLSRAEDGWRIEADAALISALTSGAVRR